MNAHTGPSRPHLYAMVCLILVALFLRVETVRLTDVAQALGIEKSNKIPVPSHKGLVYKLSIMPKFFVLVSSARYSV